VTAPKRRIKGKHLHIDRGHGAKEIHTLKKTKILVGQKPEVQLRVDIDEKTANGLYANAAAVAHSETEFIMDFLFLQTGAPKTKVHSRIVSSPKHTKRFLAALKENIRQFEKKFGPIR